MNGNQKQVYHHIQLIESAMKEAGVWSRETPQWVYTYQEGIVTNIWQWLQFIHLPMRLNGPGFFPHYLAPQLGLYVQSDPSHQHILQQVIELDSITSTLPQK